MNTWWSDDRISATVKQEYIERELGSKRHVDTLHRVLAFGDGLTDDTYLDWILERSPRIFLILNQIGVPDKIFEFIDKSFADDDLPLSQDALWDLNLFGGKSETLDKKFHREQFNFLIQELEPGGHVDYDSWDVVPVEPIVPAVRRPSITTSQFTSDKVRIHKKFYTRKRIATSEEKGIDEVPFVMQLKALTHIQHSHLVSIWATYSQDDTNYMLLHPPAETSLKTFLDEPPKAFKLLDKHERRNIFLTWSHCLTSAVAYLHSQGLVHTSIRPSTIFIDHRNAIFLNDYDALKTFEIEEPNSPYNTELYEHSAPENWFRKPCLHETAPLKIYLPGGGRTSRRIPKVSPPNIKNPLQLPPDPNPEPLKRTDSKSASSGSSTNTRPRNALITTLAPTSSQRESAIASSPIHQKRSYAADMFSLTTILLLLLSHILQHSTKSFTSHRSRPNRQAGRGSAPPDSSFHKNLGQVNKWIDMLAKEAGQREKKDMKFWGAVVEIVQVCRQGMKKDPKERIEAQDLERKIAGWVDWGLARRRKCNCKIQDTEEPPPKDAVNGSINDEPASQYRIPKLQGNKQYGGGMMHLVGSMNDSPLSPSTATFVNPERDSIQRLPSDPNRLGVWLHNSKTTSLATSMGVGQPSPRTMSIDPSKESLVWGLDDQTYPQKMQEKRGSPAPSIASGEQSTIWGLGDSDNDEDRNGTITLSARRNGGVWDDNRVSVSTSRIVQGGVSDSGSDYSADTEREEVHWPLPMGALTLK